MSETQLAAIRDAYAKAARDGDWVKCEGIARSIVQSYPDLPAGYVELAQILIDQKKDREVIGLLEASLQRFPDQPKLHYLLAVASINTGQRVNARLYLQQALALNPNLELAHFQLARLLQRSGQPAEALEHAKRACAISPTNREYISLCGEILVALERYDEAKLSLSHGADFASVNILKDLEAVDEKKPRIQRAKWPAAIEAFADLRDVVKQHVVDRYDTQGFTLAPNMRVLTQGSCFARELAYAFARYPLKVSHIPMGEEHNGTFANAIVLRWLLEGVVDEDTKVAEENLGADQRQNYLAFIQAADLYVFTLGVAPAFFSRKTGKFQMPHATSTSALRLARDCDFRTTTVAENLEQLSFIVDAVRKLNPKVTFVLTVSPVPLNTTLEMKSAVIADCVSKSTLRVVAHELVQKYSDNILYWPSFEIVRWLSAHHGVMFGRDDGSSFHVNLDVVETIIDSFVDVFGSPELKGAELIARH